MGKPDAAGIVRLNISEDRTIKLKARHRDLRDVVDEDPKNRSLSELFADKWSGWPRLIAYFARARQDPMSLDDASDLIESWVREPDPTTKKARDLDSLGKLLLQVFQQSGFLKVDDHRGKDPGDEDREGNAPPETPTAT